jgi:hypothetical protein
VAKAAFFSILKIPNQIFVSPPPFPLSSVWRSEILWFLFLNSVFIDTRVPYVSFDLIFFNYLLLPGIYAGLEAAVTVLTIHFFHAYKIVC